MSIPEDFFTPGDTGEALRSLTIIPTWDGPDALPSDHNGGRIGCNHAGGRCSEAPAGPPLHEQADRDADNVPSDRVRAYAEALRLMCRCHPADDDSGHCIPPEAVRAVTAVADREQAALRADVERLTKSLRWLHRRSVDLRDDGTLPTGTRFRRLIASIAAETLEARVPDPTDAP